jgi:hypothetical protein
MHFNPKRALGITAVPVLLGSAIAVGAAAPPAQAQTWQDTALSATAVAASSFGGGTLSAVTNGAGTEINLSSTGKVTWALRGSPPSGVSLSGTTISYSGSAVASPPEILAVATDSAGNADVLELSVTIGANSIALAGSPVKVSITSLTNANSAGTVVFRATSSAGNRINFAESGLPAGLTSGNPVLTYVGGTAAPGTYRGVKVTATDSDGAVLTGTFTLTVEAQANVISNYGDEVNPFGNGFDVYQQHDYPGAIIAGWTATQADPATHFIRNNGTDAGAYQFEYAPYGSASGLCVSDPGGGWSSDPVPNGLILTPCNTGPWQQFIPQGNGTLKNVATGLYVNPDGTGAQLRGGSSPTHWGGSVYTWTAYSNLPA